MFVRIIFIIDDFGLGTELYLPLPLHDKTSTGKNYVYQHILLQSHYIKGDHPCNISFAAPSSVISMVDDGACFM
jgi:hypothetical protein